MTYIGEDGKKHRPFMVLKNRVMHQLLKAGCAFDFYGIIFKEEGMVFYMIRFVALYFKIFTQEIIMCGYKYLHTVTLKFYKHFG